MALRGRGGRTSVMLVQLGSLDSHSHLTCRGGRMAVRLQEMDQWRQQVRGMGCTGV